MEIYFDDKLIDEDYYTGLSTNFTLFGDTFYLGSTASNNYNLSIDKEAITSHPNIVTVKNEGTLVATLVVDEVEENDFEYRYTLTDQMLNLEFKYDASELMSNGGATLLKIAQDICNKAGIELATMNFRGYNKNINWYDNTRTAREYIGYIAELNGGYAQIGKDGKLYFIKQNEPSVKTISIEDCSDFEIGEKHVITRVVYEQGTLKYEYGDETGNTLYLNGDNVYITEQSEVEEIFNEINGFEFYSFSTNNCPIDYNIMAGQIITFTDGINDYPVIAGYDELTFNGDWYGGYKLDVATKKQEETQVIGTDEKIRNLIIKVDRESNKITQAIEEIDDQNEKINKVTQTVDELNSKIQDIADITTFGESMYAKVELDSINESEPIQITVKPTVENISYLYPNSGLYPSETLYPKVRTLRFTNKSLKENEEGKYIDFIFPDDLLIASDGTCDEFYLGYDEQICQVIKRCKYNADGTVSKLDTEQIISYEYPKIQLKDGDYTIELLGYTNAYLGIRLMAQNIYTTQFATKAELGSEIKQTTDEINLSVDKKLTNYSTTTEMNSAISVKANEISSSVSKTYATKNELTTAKSEIKQTTDSIQSQVSSNDTDISTLRQTANSISSEVSKKVGNNEVISKINQSSEAVTILANKLGLTANDILNLIAGNAINLSSKNITIKSDNFNVDKNGNMDCNNATLNNITVTGNNISYKPSNSSYQSFIVYKPNDTSLSNTISWGDIYVGKGGSGNVHIFGDGTNSGIYVTNSSNETQILPNMVYTPKVIQTSKESKKKNITKYNEKALDIVKDSEIYIYNFKGENDEDKKHIGFVIGDEGGNYKTPEQVISNDREGIENYSMTSILWKAFQEYITEKDEQIEQLQKEINKLKGEKDG